jgi:hypothetical protein
MEAFVYMWENIVSGKRYIGVHKGTPDDGYIASSKIFMEDYLVAPWLFKRTILNRGSYDDMLREETAILRFSDAKHNPDFYNQHNGDGKFYNKGHTQATKEKLRKIANGELLPRPPRNTVKWTPSKEHLAKMNEGRRNSKNSPEHNEAIRQHNILRRGTSVGGKNILKGDARTDKQKAATSRKRRIA